MRSAIMSDGSKQKGKLPDHVVAPEGTSLFRTVNFERYVVSERIVTLASNL